MTVTWTISDLNGAAMTAYIAMRLAQDHVTVTYDTAVTELLTLAGIDQAAHGSGPTIKNHGNRFS